MALAGDPIIALSLKTENGVADAISLVGTTPRFIGELDIICTTTSNTDEGIDPIVEAGDCSGLDWSGVALDDEEWRPDGAGGFTRQRFYRGAAWMEDPSFFVIFQLNQWGVPVALPFVLYTGTDDDWSAFDAGFVRRFGARQVTSGCNAIDDCSGATGHVVQGLVQLRQAQHPFLDSRVISTQTTGLRVIWTADPSHHRDIPVSYVEPEDAGYGYGFETTIEPLTSPANGEYYVPGEAITFEVSFTDGDGNPLDVAGSLPTYADFFDGGTESGLRYLDILLNPTLYYALKHREGNLLVAMGGPSGMLSVTDYTVPLSDFFLPQTTAANVADHGFSAVVAGIPPFAITFGGLFNPILWQEPVSNEVTLVVPEDALPGTYVVATKARRVFGGEAVNTGDVIRIQVGTNTPTVREPTTAGCGSCHSGEQAIGNILHGFADSDSCLSGCHTSIEIEPDIALDYRVHFVHTRSDRFPADPYDCLICHVEQPTGDPRGFPGYVFPFE